MSRNAHVHPIVSGLVEAYIAPPLSTGPLEPDYVAAVTEEALSHTDVIDESDLAPVTDIDEGREDRWETRESLMSELGLRERDFR